jgi:hypothetical protein
VIVTDRAALLCVFAPFLLVITMSLADAACPPQIVEAQRAESLRWSEGERFEAFNQDLAAPYIRGVAYDPRTGRVIFSQCRPREFACDLIAIGSSEREAAYFHRSSRYGYSWPDFSPNGQSLAAVRTSRNQRADQARLSQQLVEISADSGSERVLAEAGDGRFDRVEFLSENLVLAVRSFKSSPSVRCRGDICTDVAEVLLVTTGGVRRLPMRTPAQGANVTVLSSPSANVVVVGTVRSARIASPINAYVANLSDGSGAAFSLWTDALDAARREGGATALHEWPFEWISNRSYRVEELPFCGTRAAFLTLNQTRVSDAHHAAYVVKTQDSRAYRVVTLRNQGSLPWSQLQDRIISAPLGRASE